MDSLWNDIATASIAAVELSDNEVLSATDGRLVV